MIYLGQNRRFRTKTTAITYILTKNKIYNKSQNLPIKRWKFPQIP